MVFFDSWNFLKLIYGLESIGVAFSGLLIIFLGHHLPTAFADFCLYGKLGANSAYGAYFKLPKRICFQHFYKFSGPLSTVGLLLIYFRYHFSLQLPRILIEFFHLFLGDSIQAKIPLENAVLAMIILTTHCWKRYYECHKVNVFSDVHMNVFMYLLGLFYYLGAVVSIVGEVQDIEKSMSVDLNWSRLTAVEWMSLTVALASTYLQLKASFTLSDLRRDNKGVVVTKRYAIPRGGLFEYVSSPQQLTEIVLYLCLSIILRNGSTFHFVTLLVIVNQVEHAYLSHLWYLKKFEDYPKNRKIIIPFIF